MSVRLIAMELYRLHQEVERLEKELAAATAAKHGEVKRKLERAKHERNQVRRMLDGRLDR